MNFIWNAVADRLKEFQAILGPNFKRILIIDCMQPMAQRWWVSIYPETVMPLMLKM